MNLIIVFGIFVLRVLRSNLYMFTVSNALEMSRAMVTVRVGGLCWLNPVVMMSFILWSAVVVECCFLNQCCVGMS